MAGRARVTKTWVFQTAETTKPSYFYEGFVLYGAAPGVENNHNYMIYNGFFNFDCWHISLKVSFAPAPAPAPALEYAMISEPSG
jgi:hypothetical protein